MPVDLDENDFGEHGEVTVPYVSFDDGETFARDGRTSFETGENPTSVFESEVGFELEGQVVKLERDVKPFDRDVKPFDGDVKTFELDARTFEGEVRTFECEARTLERAVRTFERAPRAPERAVRTTDEMPTVRKRLPVHPFTVSRARTVRDLV